MEPVGGSLCDLGEGSLRAVGRGRGARRRDVAVAGVDAAEAPQHEGRRDGMAIGWSHRMEVKLALQTREQ